MFLDNEILKFGKRKGQERESFQIIIIFQLKKKTRRDTILLLSIVLEDKKFKYSRTIFFVINLFIKTKFKQGKFQMF